LKTLLVTILVVGAAMAFMAIGLLFSGRSLRGSCGGNPEDCACKHSADPPSDCVERD